MSELGGETVAVNATSEPLAAELEAYNRAFCELELPWRWDAQTFRHLVSVAPDRDVVGAYVERITGKRMHVWDGECHVHAGIRPDDIATVRAAHPGADFLIHPECGCSTSVMEYVVAGDVSPEGVHMLSTGGMLRYARERSGRGNGGSATAVVATETGMLHGLRAAAPDLEFVAANEAAHCRYMKMITLPKLRDSLRDGVHEVKVPREIADRARVPIERMVAIN